MGLLVCVEAARAETSPSNRRMAEALFSQAKALMSKGDYVGACAKLAESDRLDPAGGTILNLAMCHEKEGKTATAWADFKEALSRAKRDGRTDRADAAREHIAALEPHLPALTLSVEHPPADGLAVQLDGETIAPAAWGSAFPIDPGSHKVTAAAPGRKPWSAAVEARADEQKSVTIPLLEKDDGRAQAVGAGTSVAAGTPAGTAPAGRPDDARRGGEGRRVAGYITGGVGIAAIGVGTFYGVRALSKEHESDKGCPTDTTCSVQGKAANDDAKTAAWVADIGIGAGIAAVGVAAYLLFFAGDGARTETSTARTLRVNPEVGPGIAKVTVGGAF